MSEITKLYSIEELLSKDKYVIPIYQRDFAWRNREITQLIQDIVDYLKKDKNPIKDKPNYYIGTLIVYERKNGEAIVFETIDGQQRLTTLSILLSLIKNEYRELDLTWYKEMNLQFDSRKLSTQTLQYMFNGDSLDEKECNVAIRQGYKDAKKALKTILQGFNLSIEDFYNYLIKKVSILRVLVPEDTDLNHYFEIMNSRGEQLEKHEILKAKCLEILDEEDRYAFSLIWEACSNMEKYVQYGFNVTQRDIVFGNDYSSGTKWNKLISYEDIYSKLGITTIEETHSIEVSEKINSTIEELLEPASKLYTEQSTQKDDTSERFNSVTNFSNFLLHILRIQVNQAVTILDEEKLDDKVKDVPLDDKRLIELFEPILKNPKNNKESVKNFVKNYGYNLLKGKFLFDKYIIKREFAKGTDSWSLKQLKWYEQNKNASYINTFGSGDNNEDENREILMLLSMFHVSNPTLVYKHWLNAALKYVFENENITAKKYKEYLEDLAKTFLYDRFIAKEAKEYFEIVFMNDGLCQNTKNEIDPEKLNQGTSVENFIFNYLDYLLWQNYRSGKECFKIESEKPFEDVRIKDFKYTSRSSVEHYYPQNPIEGNPKIEDRWLNHFGNLCLISNSKNSRLSNYMPIAKKDHYHKSATLDSIKQRIMMEYNDWDTLGDNCKNEVEEHGNRMIQILID
ncbi:MAG: DUF262 domain-containing HNH endonuclease family protein [Candidatus Kapabacteria bacterium]|nr:DUF262 domain-containing HNH endonuclease family protein [Candidatus Kapabacteria bacterium]